MRKSNIYKSDNYRRLMGQEPLPKPVTPHSAPEKGFIDNQGKFYKTAGMARISSFLGTVIRFVRILVDPRYRTMYYYRDKKTKTGLKKLHNQLYNRTQ